MESTEQFVHEDETGRRERGSSLPRRELQSDHDFHERFRVIAGRASTMMGSAFGFAAAVALVLAWALAGPAVNFAEWWQPMLHTITAVITFLAVFLIQNTQNRDFKAIHLKLDELIRSAGDAQNRLIQLEQANERELEEVERDIATAREVS
jgi:low affinity Fe/Cu permease